MLILSLSVLATNKKVDVFMNTIHLGSCCKVLETVMQSPTDEVAIALVKVQQLAQSISSTLCSGPGSPPLQLPLHMLVLSFQAQLQDFQSSSSIAIAENCVYKPTVASPTCLIYHH